METDNIRINGTRLWQSLMEMAKIGATEKGGVCRLALTDLDRQSRDLYISWCKEAGCTVWVDTIGNIFARWAGRDGDRPAVMIGSHLDSQPTGGKYDGAYGVLAGLEIIRTLHGLDYHAEAPIDLVMWTNEEGSRFPPAMFGSAAYTGLRDADACFATRDEDGVSVREELQRIGYAGPVALGEHRPAAFLETHIEQGPVLERENIPIGVVRGAMGQRWYEITLTGVESHAGPTPMETRRDALVGAARIVTLVREIGFAHLPDACATCGVLRVFPQSRNVIPGKTWLTVDFRHASDEKLASMHEQLRTNSARIAEELGLGLHLQEIWHTPVRNFDAACVQAVRDAADQVGAATLDIVSAAGHDAVNMAHLVPTAMVFIPCADGISHNESESIEPEHAELGCAVLLRAALALANRS